ncbi:DNA-binding transcriptional response regulator, NtrC family, contains REC, AAA-type ATPase, and a Fis-type DNA-binding domains [Spirosomataceae bacterium TFI 002]|nr:DNA-binding transcriptional response regulator, NtrC family, contains REC, AAA-type ATPase, and a Fis-type DNA-binding domains [Spirosomataceae bacterium TFI 002]
MKKIVIIDDDEDICLLMKRFLERNEFEVRTALTGASGLKILEEIKPDVILLDFKLDDMNGNVLLQKVKEIYPRVPVIIITGYSDIKIAINVLKNGAFDYVTKPLFPDEILNTIRQSLKATDEEQEEPGSVGGDETSPKTKAKKPSKKSSKKYIFGNSQVGKNLVKQLDLVSPTNFSVIIYGESGSGKEAIAQEIHNRSTRSNKPFVAMDCGALSKELAGSELFGHEKGAFTGALQQKIGHFEMANGGTLFLDEVANLSYDVQVSLLRVMQERKVRRLGGVKEIDVDVRIIVASNERLLNASWSGKFREDLYYRFNEFTIEVPPLRQRNDDIMEFAHFFLEKVNQELGKNVKGFNAEVSEIFLEYPWYGNLRELNNVIRRATLLAESDSIKVANLPYEVSNHKLVFFGDQTQISVPNVMANSKDLQMENNSSANYENHSKEQDIHDPKDLKDAAVEAEYDLILDTLKKVNFNKSKAAKLLNIDRKTLYNKLKHLKK